MRSMPTTKQTPITKQTHAAKQTPSTQVSKKLPTARSSAPPVIAQDAATRSLSHGWNWPIAAALLFMATIFWASSRTSLPSVMFPTVGMDKLYHGIAYAVLGWLLAGGFSFWLRSPYWVVWSATVVGALYGFSDELHQSFVPGRDASGGDVIADVIGAFVGAMLWWVGWRWRQLRAKSGNTVEILTARPDHATRQPPKL